MPVTATTWWQKSLAQDKFLFIMSASLWCCSHQRHPPIHPLAEPSALSMFDPVLTTRHLVRRLPAALVPAVASAVRSHLSSAAASYQAAPSGAAPG